MLLSCLPACMAWPGLPAGIQRDLRWCTRKKNDLLNTRTDIIYTHTDACACPDSSNNIYRAPVPVLVLVLHGPSDRPTQSESGKINLLKIVRAPRSARECAAAAGGARVCVRYEESNHHTRACVPATAR